MKSKRLLIMAAQAFKNNDLRRSGQLFASAMAQADSVMLIRELTESEPEESTSIVGMNNEQMRDLDLPIGDERQRFQDRLSSKYPQIVTEHPFDPMMLEIPLRPANDGSAIPSSGGYLHKKDPIQEETDAEIAEEFLEDPEHVPSSLSSVDVSEKSKHRSHSSVPELEVEELSTSYGIRKSKGGVVPRRTSQRIVI